MSTDCTYLPHRLPPGSLDTKMLAWQTSLVHQLEQLDLIQCSLLPGESFAFVLPPDDLAVWSSLLDAFTDAGRFSVDDADDHSAIASLTKPPCQARFEIRVVGVRTWFEVTLPRCTDTDGPTSSGLSWTTSASTRIAVSVKGQDVSRDAHERWYAEIRARVEEMDAEAAEGRAFPVYELVTHLTTSLNQSQAPSPAPTASPPIPTPIPMSTSTTPVTQPSLYHALLTSHHLVSPTKRRNLFHLSTHLVLAGFAKIGYPGIIYAQGDQEAVEAFVREVKGWQWLALRVRFVEPAPRSESESDGENTKWVEMTKIGEVLEWMRIRGREALVTDLGIGASSKEPGR
ncbi:hypothetical protein EV363DRAFT_1398583 [Boletus edulis]|nr:hypothetical protein EV363DRAFT_1398583 [Boletus edulis]